MKQYNNNFRNVVLVSLSVECVVLQKVFICYRTIRQYAHNSPISHCRLSYSSVNEQHVR